MSALLPVKTFLTLKFFQKQNTQQTKNKVRKTIFQNIKDLIYQNSNITKFRSSDYESFCETNVLEN